MDNGADIVWAVSIDASEGLAALEQSLSAAAGQLDAVDARATETGKTISDAVLPSRSLSIDSKSLETVGAALLVILERLAAIQTSAASATIPASPPPGQPAAATPKLVQSALPAPPAAATPTPLPLAAASLPAPETPTQALPAPPAAATPTQASPVSAAASPPAGAKPAPVATSPAVERARLEMLSTQRTAEGVGAAFRLAFEQAGEAMDAATAKGSASAKEAADNWRKSLGLISADFRSGAAGASESLRSIAITAQEQSAAIKSAMSAAATAPTRPVTIQTGMASAPIRQAREEMLATEKTAEGVSAAIRLAAANLAEIKAPEEFVNSIRLVQKDFLAGRLKSAMSAAATAPTRPVTIQTGMASAPIRQAREEMLATEKTAEGVSAAIRLAAANLAEIKAPEEFVNSIRLVQKDFLAGRATADESLRAIVSAQRAASAEIMDAKRQEAAAFEEAERDKQKAAEATKRAQDDQAAAIAKAGQVFGTLTSTAASSVAMMLSLEERTRSAYGETEYQLHGLRQLQEGIPHVTSLLTGLGAAMTGGPAGLLAGIPAIITGITGIFSAMNRPMPRPPSQKESVEDTFSRIQTGALKSDSAQGTREEIARTVRMIERAMGAHTGAPVPLIGT